MEDDLTELRQLFGRYAFQRLREGKATLTIWRGSSPHNYFIESKKSRSGFLWHADTERPRVLPNMEMFELVSESNDKIAYSNIHYDGGKSYTSDYVLKKEYRILK
jgi:hypothetical protein